MAAFYLVLAKYLMVIFMALYTWECFSALKKRPAAVIRRIFARQNALIYLFHFVGSTVIYINNPEDEIILFYGVQLIYFVVVLGVFPIIYPKISRALLSNMCMLLSIGFIMLTRLDYGKSLKQFAIAALATAFSLVVPLLISNVRFWHKITWLYAVVGIILLGVVLVLGVTSYGANLSLSLGSLSVQPSEFVKILFVFFVAGILYKNEDFIHIVISAAVAGIHILLLVCSKDLGSALIFCVVYIFMLYVGTGRLRYLLLGFAAGAVASVAAVQLFSHVRTRVAAWLDPWSIIDSGGYQITQSLFAIGAGKWNGTGLYEGSPKSIPTVEKDFAFSAIAEEFGTFFAILLILVCLSCFMAFIKTAAGLKNRFYKLIGLGLAVSYATQVFLTIGGALKMIPSTGVTLPLVSYGGSSILSTLIIFAIIQGLVIVESKEERQNGRRKKKTDGRPEQNRNAKKIRQPERGGYPDRSSDRRSKEI